MSYMRLGGSGSESGGGDHGGRRCYRGRDLRSRRPHRWDRRHDLRSRAASLAAPARPAIGCACRPSPTSFARVLADLARERPVDPRALVARSSAARGPRRCSGGGLRLLGIRWRSGAAAQRRRHQRGAAEHRLPGRPAPRACPPPTTYFSPRARLDRQTHGRRRVARGCLPIAPATHSRRDARERL